MYHALLTNRYLTSRVIPLIAVAAVALCVALVIIVVSVMTGFLNMVKDSGRTLIGDVVISYAVSGIPHYQNLIDRIEALPEVAAATPVVDTWGLVRMPYPPGEEKQVEFVQLWGIEPQSFSEVTGFEATLHWKTPSDDQRQMLMADVIDLHWQEFIKSLTDDQRFNLIKTTATLRNPQPPTDEQLKAQMRSMPEDLWRQVLFALANEDGGALQTALGEDAWRKLLEFDPRLSNPNQLVQDGVALTRSGQPAIVLGMHVSDGNERTRSGEYQTALGYWMPRFDVTITTLPVVGGGMIEPESVILPVANEFSSGVFLIDDTRAMIPIDTAQRLMHLNEEQRVDPSDPSRVLGVDPAKATMILVRAKDRDNVSPEQLRDAVDNVYRAFEQEMSGELVRPPVRRAVSINTWAQQQSQFIGPVEKEREMMRTLFSLVYIVCAGLVLAIFWAIVYEKTRDIGILRSVGASRIGISWIFLRYGLVVGVLGALVGFGLGALVVRKINVIHEALSEPPLAVPITVLTVAAIALVITLIKAVSGNLLPVVLGGLVTAALLIAGFLSLWLYNIGGFLMWDPAVYYFEKIPNQVDVESAIITMIGAVVFSLIGAFVPAAKAADTDPVRALRYE